MTHPPPASGRLPWPMETAGPENPDDPNFSQPGSNICLDFHGDPGRAGLVVFSDGNHHMALAAAARRFLEIHPGVEDIFYATTPPGPLVAALERGTLGIGNLTLSVAPNVFIGPENILGGLRDAGQVAAHQIFAESRGNALLVRKGNPKNITGAADLMADGVVVAISNPRTEAASFQVYRDTLAAMAAKAGGDAVALCQALEAGDGRVVHSQAIHHREVPQLIAEGRADVAMVYYHLALRYTRIFPDLFEIINPQRFQGDPEPGQQTTRYHLGLVGDGGAWGAKFRDFMIGDEAGGIYEYHGLRHRLSLE